MKRQRETSPSRTYQFDWTAALRSKGVGPYAAYFQAGYLKQDKCSWKAYTHEDWQSNQFLVGSADIADFIGSTHGPESGGRIGCSNAVGVLDKATGSLQMFPLEGEYVMRMEGRFRGVDYGPSTAGQNMEIDSALRRMQNKTLVEHFGSQKSRRAIKAREAAEKKAKEEAEFERAERASRAEQAATDFELFQATTVGLEELEDFGSLEEERPLPPHHLDEQSPDKAYVLGELVGEAEGALITQEILRATSDTAYREGEFTSLKLQAYVKRRIAALASIPEARRDEAFEGRCEALALLQVLLQLYKAPNTMSAPSEGDPWPSLAQKSQIEANALSGVLHKFYELKKDSPKDRDIYLRTEHSKALLLFHCAIVALLAEGFHMPPDVFDSFRDQMELTPIQMREIFRELGCTTVAKRSPEFAPGRFFDIRLLPRTQNPTTLREALPSITQPPRAPRGRK